jgi:hypothetical protein
VDSQDRPTAHARPSTGSLAGDLASHFAGAASKTAGRRRGQPLTVTETVDNTVLLGVATVLPVAAAAVWWRRSHRR